MKNKTHFDIILKGLSVVRNCLRSETGPETIISSFFYLSQTNIFLKRFCLKLFGLKCFFKDTTICNSCRLLCLWYNSSNISYIFYNKLFTTFLGHQISKDKPTPLLSTKKPTLLMQETVIFFKDNYFFLFSVYSLRAQLIFLV